MTDIYNISLPTPLVRMSRVRTLLVLCAGVLALVLLGWWSLERQDKNMRSDLLSDARAAAKAINWRHIQSLTASDADLASMDYQRLKEQLSMVKTAKPEYRFTYILGQRPDGSMFFYVDSEAPDSKDYSPPGQIYTEVADSFRNIFKTGRESVAGPVTDRWGTWVSALVPITDPRTGKLLALFGVDRNAADWNIELAKEVAEQMGLIMMFVAPSSIFLILRRRNELMLCESQQHLSDIIQFFPDATVVINNQGKVSAWNRAMEELSGVKAADILGKGNYEYALPFYGVRRPILIDLVTLPKEEVERKYKFTERHGNKLAGEAYFQNYKGNEIYMQGTAAVLRNSYGEIIGAIEAVRDITRRKKAEEKLAEKERLLTAILDGIQDGICMLDEELRIVRVNPFFENYYAEKMPFLGQKCHEVFWSSTEPCDQCPSIRTLQSGERAFKVFSNSNDGQDAWFELESFPLLDMESSRVTGVVECVRNITERKQAEEALAASEDRFRSLVENTSDWVWEVDENGYYTYASPQVGVILGYEPEEMLGKNPFDLMSRDEAERVAILFSAIIANRNPIIALENMNLHKDGRTVVLETSGVPFFDEAGTFKGYRGIDRDITERKRAADEIYLLNTELEAKIEEKTKQLLEAQEDLVRKEKLAILGQLSGSVGHELRNPLGVMNNAVYFLKMVYADADETTHEYLDIIKHEIDNSQRIISDLLDFARTKTPQTATVTARQLLEESLDKCVIPENVVLTAELPRTLPSLKIDPLQMGQVLQNLIINAIQAMPNGGTLQVGARRDADFIEISVADTGEGITPEHMKKLFQPLFTTKARGIGLGLVVCRNLTEANGGRIEVESELGKGATFSIHLPMEKIA